MQAETIAIGTELTTGAKLDTNSQWLSLELAAVGIPVWYHTTVADTLEANLLVFRQAVDRADIVLITGGLGPTLDDLTREALAAMLGVELVLDEPSLQIIKDMFSHRNRVMPDRNSIQAMFPVGTEPIPNPRGTAPGIWIEIPRPGKTPCRLAAMPGVPSEMKPMFRDSVLPRLADLCGTGKVIRSSRVNCFGLGESHADELLGDLTARGRDPEVGITVHEGTITLRIESQGDSVEECEVKIQQARATARERLGGYVFGDDDEELQHIVLRHLSQQETTLITAESATGGILATWLSNIDGPGSWYHGGWVGTEARLAAQLGLHFVPHLEPASKVSNLAQHIRQQTGTDYVLAVGDVVMGVNDPKNPAIEKVYVALAGAGVSITAEIQGLSDPTILKSRAAKTALDLLRKHLRTLAAQAE
ncbi:MAG: CinA family nicotinamide mononucleotide deamidase-related protein [Planctomycetota bacterium]